MEGYTSMRVVFSMYLHKADQWFSLFNVIAVVGTYSEVDRRPKPTAEGRSFYSYGYGYGGRRFRAIASAEGALEISMSDSFLECN